MSAKAKLAVCVFLSNVRGRALSVSRKDDPNDLGLPGGKVEPGEDFRTAAARELLEETGITVNPSDLFELYVGKDANGYTVTTYVAYKWKGTIQTSEAGKVAWVEPEELVTGSFGDYNRAVLDAFVLDAYRDR